MVLESVFRVCQDEVFDIPSSEILFNPYRDEDRDLDRRGAAAMRRANLRRYLETFPQRPSVILLAEAPGPWGCRFSGVPVTSEQQLLDRHFPFSGEQTSGAEEPYTEYSASIFWRVLEEYHPSFLIWNSVPLHPRRPGEPQSIRTPSLSEVRRFSSITERLIEELRPVHVGAIGRKAERQLQELGVSCTYVRHPSQGGARLFEAGVISLLRDASNLWPGNAGGTGAGAAGGEL